MKSFENCTVAVVGAGAMGVGIALVGASAGHAVVVIDVDSDALKRGSKQLAESLDTAVAKRRISQYDRDQIWSSISWTSDLNDSARAFLVVEAIIERMDAKQALFRAIEPLVAENAILASNTSSLSIDVIGSSIGRAERFLGLHFFNPVPAMILVEVVAGSKTDINVANAAVRLMESWGKTAVRARDVPGFIVNRVARPYYSEAFAALSDGVMPEVVDAAMTQAASFRMGPLELADLIGHDVNYAVARSVHEAGFGTTRFQPQPAQALLVERGHLGRKSGRGVYLYDAPLLKPARAARGRRPSTLASSGARLLAPLVEQAERVGFLSSTTVAGGPETLVADETVMALGDGRTLAARPSVDVLIDHVRDFSHPGIMILTARSSEHAQAALGFFGAIGRTALLTPDRPGQLVLRTLAQLANAAADAVVERVASEADVEAAMKLGAYHPEGPLARAGRVGHDWLRQSLRNLASATNSTLYNPSSFFEGSDR